MEQLRSCLVLINRKSGTVRTRGADAVKKLVEEKLQAAFPVLDVKLVDGDVMPPAEAAVRNKSHDVIIAGGGDGTIGSVAGLMVGKPQVMGALPLGTMNLVVQALGFSPKLEEALEQMARAHVDRIDVGMANDRVFLHQVSFGLQPRMARLRERLGYGSRLGKMMAAARAYLSISMRPRMVRAAVTIDGRQMALSAPFLAVTNNPLDLKRSWTQPHKLDQGVLGFYALSAISLPALLKLATSYLRGQLPEAEHLENQTARELTVAARPRRLPTGLRRRPRARAILASIDGEVALMELPVKIVIAPQSLQVLSARDEGAKE